MKKIILSLIVILIFGCEDKKGDKSDKKVEIQISNPAKEIRYINAKSGLIYRDKPKGEKLGKIEFNNQITIIEHTNIFQEIKNGNKKIKGEWVGTNLGNKNVYVFDGFLSDTKSEITPELIKYFMGDEILWLSKEFKTILEETKLIQDAYGKSEFYSDIVYTEFDNNPGLICNQNSMEPTHFAIDFSLNSNTDNKVKIIDINQNALTVEKGNKEYIFFKSNTKIISESGYWNGGGTTASEEYTNEWLEENFQGRFIFKSGNESKIYNSKNIHYYYDFFSGDVVKINNRIYSIDKLTQKTYYLSEIAFDEMDEIEMKETGKTATLTKE